MDRKLTVVLKPQGVRALLKSPEVAADLKARAERVRAKAEQSAPGFRVTTGQGPSRARARVYAAKHAARVAEAEDRALTSAIQAGK